MSSKKKRKQASSPCHPSVILPDLVNSLPPELFERVLPVIFPDINDLWEKLNQGYNIRSELQTDRRSTTADQDKKHGHTHRKVNARRLPPQNPYYKYLRKMHFSDGAPLTPEEEAILKQGMHTHAVAVAKEFSEWLEGLGGEDPEGNIDPEKLVSMFAVGGESKHQVGFPVEAVDEQDVPQELSLADRNNSDGVTGRPNTTGQQSARRPYTTGTYGLRHSYGAWFVGADCWDALRKRRLSRPS